MPLDPTIPNPPDPFPGLDAMVEAQRLRDLDREQRMRDKFGSKPESEFSPPPYGSSSEETALENRRQARLNGDPVPPMAGELPRAE
jgi:hypothetical protein